MVVAGKGAGRIIELRMGLDKEVGEAISVSVRRCMGAFF
jgi:hypothetical protein